MQRQVTTSVFRHAKKCLHYYESKNLTCAVSIFLTYINIYKGLYKEECSAPSGATVSNHSLIYIYWSYHLLPLNRIQAPIMAQLPFILSSFFPMSAHYIISQKFGLQVSLGSLFSHPSLLSPWPNNSLLSLYIWILFSLLYYNTLLVPLLSFLLIL